MSTALYYDIRDKLCEQQYKEWTLLMKPKDNVIQNHKWLKNFVLTKLNNFNMFLFFDITKTGKSVW